MMRRGACRALSVSTAPYRSAGDVILGKRAQYIANNQFLAERPDLAHNNSEQSCQQISTMKNQSFLEQSHSIHY
jgi:hypothetical protein